MYKLDYLTIPLLLEAEYGKKICFYANAGLYFSYLLNQNYTGENERSGAGYWLQISPNSTHNKNNFDFGICAETGMKIKVSNELAIYFGLCDRLGLFNTEKQPLFIDEIGNQVNSETTSFNNVTLLILGFSYRFGSIKK